MPDTDLHPFSVPVDRARVDRSGALTSLPVRIHRFDRLADAGALCLTNDWRRTMRDERHLKSNGSPSVVGNWASFIWPECRPERLGLLTYLLDAGCFHDDACEEMSIAAAHQEHLDLEAAMDVEDRRALSRDSHSQRTKQLISAAVLECIKVDRPGALRMLKAYRTKWLRVMETVSTEAIGSVDEYFAARANNGGMGAYYTMLEFSLGITVSEPEYARMAEAISHVERCMLLTNDYWSWPRERAQSRHQEAGKVFNIVWFLMHHDHCTEEEAIAKVRIMVRAEEQAWVEAKNRLCAQEPPAGLRGDLVKFLENLHTALAGNDYWSSQCYRHNEWDHVPALPGDDAPKVGELAAFGRVLARELPDAHDALTPEEVNKPPEIVQIDTGTPVPTMDTTLDDDSSPTVSHGEATSSSGYFHFTHMSQPQSSASTPPSLCTTDPNLPATLDQTPDTLAHPPVTEPAAYIRHLPSKNLRGQLIDALNLWLCVPSATLSSIKSVIDCLHHSSLILDDIEDGSALRRGFPAAHVVYGVGQAVNSATYLYVRAVEAVHTMARDTSMRDGGNTRGEMMDILLKYLKQLFAGQSWDLYWTHHRRCPTEDEYLAMVDMKTGAMLQLLVGLMQCAAKQPQQQARRPDFAVGMTTTSLGARDGDAHAPTHHVDEEEGRHLLTDFTRLFGRFFQVRDDFLNLAPASSAYARQKGWAEDLDEQKFSYMVVWLYARRPAARDKIEGVFRTLRKTDGVGQKEARETSKRYILGILEDTGALEAARRLLERWQGEMEARIGDLERYFGWENVVLRLVVETLRV